MNRKIIIVGGVAGGATAAARLRRLDEHAEIILFERGEHISYANCGLPYYIGGVIRERDKLFVQTAEAFRLRFRVDVRTRCEVARIDRPAKAVEVRELVSGRVSMQPYDSLVLSPGAEPVRPPVPGIEDPAIFTLRNVADTDAIRAFMDAKRPRRAVVIGAGFIGLEMAENLHRQGIFVTIIELADQVMVPLDFDMAAAVHQHLKSKKVELYLRDGVAGFSRPEGRLIVKMTGGRELQADMVILSIGIRPENKLAKEAGLTLGERGAIRVNEFLQTSDPDIYAVGDAVESLSPLSGKYASVYLAGPANKQGRIAADNIINPVKTPFRGAIGTAVAKVFDLTVAVTGLAAKTCRRDNIPFLESIIHVSSHAGYYPDAHPMTLKVVFEPGTGRLLGAQAAGYEGIDKRIDVIAALLRHNGTVHDLAAFEHAYAPPYSSAKDPVNVAGNVAANILKGLVRTVQWHELSGMLEKGALPLDIRTEEEFRLGTIPGALNIPLDSLREKLDTLPKNRAIVVFCSVGLRAYLACRILEQSGFTQPFNLAGGYKTYEHVSGTQGNEDIYEKDFVGKDDHIYQSESGKETPPMNGKTIRVDACGLQCPGPILRLKQELDRAAFGDTLELLATDPGFARDVSAWCGMTGHRLLSLTEDKGTVNALIRKTETSARPLLSGRGNDKTLIVFSDDMDKALASFVIANGASSTGSRVTMFFTFWGLNVIKRRNKPSVKKDLMGRMFGLMMPSDSRGLNLSKINMLGLGRVMMKWRMKSKNVDALEIMMGNALKAGVEMVACQMSMDIMGVASAELMDGVKIGGVATYLAAAESANLNLFI